MKTSQQDKVEYPFERMRIMILALHFVEDDSKNPCAQHLITNDTNSASLGELSHIINADVETICVKFESHAGKEYFYIYRYSFCKILIFFLQLSFCLFRFRKISKLFKSNKKAAKRVLITHGGIISFTILSILWIFESATKHDARLCAY